MDLFLDNSNVSFLSELLADYLRLISTNRVNPIHLNASTLKLINDGTVKIPSPPTLITEEGLIITKGYPIAFHMIKLAFADILLGDDKEEESKVISVFEICERKSLEEVLKHFNELLLKSTFLVGYHVTLADLCLFAYAYPSLVLKSDEELLKYPSIFRWINHIQNLSPIKAFLEKTSRNTIEFPVECKDEKANKKKKK